MQRSPKFLLTFLGFLITVLCFTFFIIDSQKEAERAIHTAHLDKRQNEPHFFYKTIGHAPFKPKVAQEEPALEQFTVQLDVVYNQAKAESKLKEYQKKGLEAFFTPLHQKGQIYYRLRYGITKTEKEANDLARQLMVNHGIKGVVKAL